jgi:hypothetical protein
MHFGLQIKTNLSIVDVAKIFQFKIINIVNKYNKI